MNVVFCEKALMWVTLKQRLYLGFIIYLMKFVDLLSYYLLGSQKSDPSGSPKTNKNIEKEESLETNNEDEQTHTVSEWY